MRRKIPIVLLSSVLLCSIIYIFLLQKSLMNCGNCDNYEKSVESISNGNTTDKEKEYNCTFTKTYRVVNLLDGYIAEVPELSYVILDAYLDHSAFSHLIPSNLKTKLETNKYYEFTYQIKGSGNLKDIDDIYQEIAATELYSQANDKTKNKLYKDKKLFVYLTVNETNKKGVEQINEDICG